MTLLADQLPLPLALAPRPFDTPVAEAASNAQARAWLARTGEWPQRRLALWGPPGSGKTSLLRHWAARHGAAPHHGARLQLHLPHAPLAIDNAAAAPERTLLHVLNAAQEAGHPVLLADVMPPARWPVALPDLASRLRATAAVAIAAPEDSLLHALLARQLAARQLRVPEPTLLWLLARLPRTHAAIIDAVERLDRAAQRAGLPIAPSLARLVLPELRGDVPDGPSPAPSFDLPASPFHEALVSPPPSASPLPGALL